MTERNTDESTRHDEGASRLTPYEVAFGKAAFETKTFPALEAEAETGGVNPTHRDRFGFLSVGSDVLRDVVPPDAPPDALEQYRALLFHAFNFWRSDKQVYRIEQPVVRYLVEAAPALRDWEFALPHPSVYVQLPRNLFWASVTPDSTPEPVDGLFATAARSSDPLGPPYQQLEVLMALGVRRDRAGFSVIPFETEIGPGIAASWAEAAGREGASDFENVLPGGDIAGLYSILTTAEALKLLARALWYIDRHPEDVVEEDAPAVREADGPTSLPESKLPYHRVRFGGGGEGGSEG